MRVTRKFHKSKDNRSKSRKRKNEFRRKNYRKKKSRKKNYRKNMRKNYRKNMRGGVSDKEVNQAVADGNYIKLAEIIREYGEWTAHKDKALEKLRSIYPSHPAVSEGISDKAKDKEVNQAVATKNFIKLAEILGDVDASRVHKNKAFETLQSISPFHNAVGKRITERREEDEEWWRWWFR